MHPTQAIMHTISCGMHPIMRFYQNGLLLPLKKADFLLKSAFFCTFWAVLIFRFSV